MAEGIPPPGGQPSRADRLADALAAIDAQAAAARPVPGRAGVEARLAEIGAGAAPAEPSGPGLFARAKGAIGGMFGRRGPEAAASEGEASGVEDEVSTAAGRPLTDTERVGLRERVGRAIGSRLPAFLSGATIGDYLKATAEASKAAPGAMLDKISFPKELAKVVGSTLAWGVVAAGLRTGARIGISQLGMFGSAGLTIGTATLASGGLSGVREVIKQFKTERTSSRSAEWAEARARHRNLITASWSYADKTKIVKQIAKGMVTGFIGSTLGVGIAELGVLDSAGRFVFDKLGGETLSNAGGFVSDQWKAAQGLDKDIKQFVSDKTSGVTKPITDAVKGVGSTVADATQSPRDTIADKWKEAQNLDRNIRGTITKPFADAGKSIGDTVSGVTEGPRGFVAEKFEGAKNLVGLGSDTQAAAPAPAPAPEAPAPIAAPAPVDAPAPAAAFQTGETYDSVSNAPAQGPDTQPAAAPQGLTPEQQRTWDAYKTQTDANTQRVLEDNKTLEQQNAELRKQLAEAQAKATVTPGTGTAPGAATAGGPSGVPGAGAGVGTGPGSTEIGVVPPSGPTIPKELFNIPGVEKTADGLVYSLPQGSNPWEVARKAAGVILNENHQPLANNDPRLVAITQELLKQSQGIPGADGNPQIGVRVPGWPGTEGPQFTLDQRSVPPGYKLNFNKDVLDTISKFKNK